MRVAASRSTALILVLPLVAKLCTLLPFFTFASPTSQPRQRYAKVSSSATSPGACCGQKTTACANAGDFQSKPPRTRLPRSALSALYLSAQCERLPVLHCSWHAAFASGNTCGALSSTFRDVLKRLGPVSPFLCQRCWTEPLSIPVLLSPPSLCLCLLPGGKGIARHRRRQALKPRLTSIVVPLCLLATFSRHRPMCRLLHNAARQRS